MKKLLAFLLAAAVLTSFAACGSDTKVEETTDEVETTAAPEGETTATTEGETTDAPETDAPETLPPPDIPTEPTDPGEFDNALFIGDSRTLGLLYYGNLGTADVFATKGMTIFRVFNEIIDVKSAGETNLESLLASKKYDKIYIMLGLNEIGANIEGIKLKYSALVDRLLETQDSAKIYVCANLHITNSRSEWDEIYNNTRLNAINDYVSTLANGENVQFVDVNIMFDDKSGGFREDYAADDFHPEPECYRMWVRWLGSIT